MAECGDLPSTKEQECDFSGNADIKCCPEWGVSGLYSKCDDCILPQWNEDELCCDIHPDAKAKRERSRECFVVEYSDTKQVMSQALMAAAETTKTDLTKCGNGDSTETASCLKPTETDDIENYDGNYWCCAVDLTWSEWQTCKNDQLVMTKYGDKSCAISSNGECHWGLHTRSRNHLCLEPHADSLEKGTTGDCPSCLNSEPCQIDACPQWAPWSNWSG